MSRGVQFVFASCLIGLSVPALAAAATGDLDPSWGTGGVARVSGTVDPQRAVTQQLGAQSSGRVVVAYSTGDGTIVVKRLLGDGAPDSSFTNSSDAGCGELRRLVVLSDDRILVQGDSCLRRLQVDGLPDSTFNSTGTVATPDAVDMAVDQSERPLVLSHPAADPSQYSGGLLTRFTPSGQPDSGFGDAGSIVLDMFEGDDPLTMHVSFDTQRLAVDHVGRILLGGAYGSGYRAPAVARLKADGSRDDAFGGPAHDGYDAGVVRLQEPSGSLRVRVDDLLVAPNDDVAATSFVGVASSVQPKIPAQLARIHNGQLDPTFGSGGVVQLSSIPSPQSVDQTADVMTSGDALALASDGRLAVTGQRECFHCATPYIDPISTLVTDSGQIDQGYGVDGFQRWESDDGFLDALVVDNLLYTAGRDASYGEAGRLLVSRQLLGSGHDRDADGVRDSKDPCPSAYARGGEGCPADKPEIDVRGGKKRREFRVLADSEACFDRPLIVQRFNRASKRWVDVRAQPSQRPVEYFNSTYGVRQAYDDLRPGRYRAVIAAKNAATVRRSNERVPIADCKRSVKPFSV